MLTNRLSLLKRELEHELNLSDDDKVTLTVLDFINQNASIQQIIVSNNIMKSFGVVSDVCSQCGKPLN